jgi:hypothetical protein
MLTALPATAEEPNRELSEGLELLGEGARLLLRGLQTEMEPMAEGWGVLVEKLGDFSLYQMPEILPNGDIVIRRKEPLTGEEGATDL